MIALEAEPLSNSRTAARVTVRYGSPELGPVPNAVQITITGSTARKLTSLNPDGTPLVVKYTDPAGNVLQDRLQVPVLSPNTILQFTRLEPSQSAAPVHKIPAMREQHPLAGRGRENLALPIDRRQESGESVAL